jgi:hypothetical protein
VVAGALACPQVVEGAAVIDRKAFFTAARERPFGGSMTQRQVDGCNALLDEWEARYPAGDLRWLAYELATCKWETGHTMQPVEEWGHGAGHPYGVRDPITGQVYDGRGDVQLTWRANYQKMSGVVGVDLVNHPELALDPRIAAAILFEGMEHGDFTGVGLPEFFNPTTDDPVGARRIINGTDHAEDIAEIHRGFLAALQGGGNATA